MKDKWSLSALILALLVGGVVARTQTPTPPPVDAWRTFEGEWSATGQASSLQTEGNRPASIVQLSGALVIAGQQRLGRGFRGEFIGFDDGRDIGVGRAVWTDERGDRVFSEMKGGAVRTGRRFVGTITGGTGRYAGVVGAYEFTWQYVVTAEDGSMQGRTVGLKGRVRGGTQ